MGGKNKPPATVDEYIKDFPTPVAKKLAQLRAAVRAAAPEALEKFGYGMPGYYLNGPLVYFAAHARHIGLYALPAANVTFAKELAGYKTSKGAVQFPLDKPLPIGIVKKMVAFRVAANAARKRPTRKAGGRTPG